MNIELSKEQFRLLLDLVYVGNWVMNSARGDDRINEYDEIESLIFACCEKAGFKGMTARMPEVVPSKRYVEGGIHEAIMDYEDTVFYNILAEELARRDLKDRDVDGEDKQELYTLMERYFDEFYLHGIDNVNVDGVGGADE